MNTTNKTKGFTIIEVVLVLAIAGLIFLMVFLALPALQRTQKNNALRSEVTRVMSLAVDYRANSNGSYVGSTTTVQNLRTQAGPDQLLGITFASVPADINATAIAALVEGNAIMTRGTCTGDTATQNTTAQSYAIQYKQYGGQQACIQSNA